MSLLAQVSPRVDGLVEEAQECAADKVEGDWRKHNLIIKTKSPPIRTYANSRHDVSSKEKSKKQQNLRTTFALMDTTGAVATPEDENEQCQEYPEKKEDRGPISRSHCCHQQSSVCRHQVDTSKKKSPEDFPSCMPLLADPHPSYRDSKPGRCEDVDELLLGGEQVEVRFQTSVE